MKKEILFSIAVILLSGIALAEIESLGSVKQNDCISLPQVCPNCSWVNISSVTYPNKTMVVNEWPMTKSGITYNYIFCGNKEIGQMIINGHGDVDGLDTPFGYDYEVTSTGKTGGYIIPLFFMLGGFLIFGIALWQKNEYIGLFSGFAFIVSAIYMMIYGLGSLMDTYTRMFSFIALGIGLTICFASVYEMYHDED